MVENTGQRDKLYQVYLGQELEEALKRYTSDKFPPGTRVTTSIIRRSVAEFLEREGYYNKG